MLVVETILRIFAAALECRAAELKNATPEQAQAIIARHEALLAPFTKLLRKFSPESEA